MTTDEYVDALDRLDASAHTEREKMAIAHSLYVEWLEDLDDPSELDDPLDREMYDYLHGNYPEHWTDEDREAFDAEMEERLREDEEDDA